MHEDTRFRTSETDQKADEWKLGVARGRKGRQREAGRRKVNEKAPEIGTGWPIANKPNNNAEASKTVPHKYGR